MNITPQDYMMCKSEMCIKATLVALKKQNSYLFANNTMK